MSRVMLWCGLAVAVTVAPAATPGTPQQGRPVFKADVDAVLVDVAVTDGKRSVPNLTPADFLVTDNGVEQTVTGLDFGRIPMDVRLIFDTSGSLSEAQLARHTRAMRQVSEALSAADRCEVLQFRSHAVRVTPLQSPPVDVMIDRSGPEGTAFFDAVSLAMITGPRPGRRQLTILLSDAADTASFFDWPALEHAAERSDAVLYTVSPIVAGGRTIDDPPFQGRLSSNDVTTRMMLERLAAATGGRLVELAGNGDIGASFLQALEEFRQSYVLRYSPAGVARPGWHTLTVTIRGGKKYNVRAKRGYDGS